MKEKLFNKRWKRWVAVGVLTLLVFIVIIVLGVRTRDILFYVDDIPIYKEEFLLQAKQESTAVRHGLQAAHTPNTFSWEQTFDEKTGTEWLVEKTVDQLVQQKIVQQTGHQYGLLESPEYPDIVDMIAVDNHQRNMRKQSGQAVFGLPQMSIEEGVNYLNNNLVLQLPQILWDKGDIYFTQQELEDYYQQHKGYFLDQPMEEVEEHVQQALLEEKTEEYLALKKENAQISTLDTQKLVRLLAKEVAY